MPGRIMAYRLTGSSHGIGSRVLIIPALSKVKKYRVAQNKPKS